MSQSLNDPAWITLTPRMLIAKLLELPSWAFDLPVNSVYGVSIGPNNLSIDLYAVNERPRTEMEVIADIASAEAEAGSAAVSHMLMEAKRVVNEHMKKIDEALDKAAAQVRDDQDLNP